MFDKFPINENGLEAYLETLVHDSRTLLQDLSKSSTRNYDVIDIYADIPEYDDPDYIIGLIQRLDDVSKFFGKPIRVYTYLHNIHMEKNIQRLLVNRNNICITCLPHYIRKKRSK